MLTTFSLNVMHLPKWDQSCLRLVYCISWKVYGKHSIILPGRESSTWEPDGHIFKKYHVKYIKPTPICDFPLSSILNHLSYNFKLLNSMKLWFISENNHESIELASFLSLFLWEMKLVQLTLWEREKEREKSKLVTLCFQHCLMNKLNPSWLSKSSTHST